MMNGEGDKLVVVAKNLDLIYKAVVGMEAQIEIMSKELDSLKAPATEEQEPVSEE